MVKKWKETILNIVSSRLFVVLILFIILAAIMIYRVFVLQIVRGEEYLDNFQLKIVRERTLPSTRGKIYDCNGNLIAYNDIAYNITIEDVFESGSKKNAVLNTMIYRLIGLIENSGDDVISDFNIVLDNNNHYVYTVEGTRLLRFLADIYGKKKTDELDYKQRTSTATELIEYLCKRYGIGEYTDPNDKSTFVPGAGYTKSEVLKMINIRYALTLNGYQKYIATIVATDVSQKTLATVMEHKDELPGVNVAQDTVRRYNDAVYFSQIIGYTGKISQEEYDELSLESENYTLNDYIGKTGIEASMESHLQGKKGSETIYVDNLGKIIATSDYVEPMAGNDIYLTIDRDLQIAVYNLLEQKLAGILVAKIRNVKEFNPPENASASNIIIPIDDVYFALFDNNVIDVSRFTKDYASVTEKEVYAEYLAKKERVFAEIENELLNNATPYNQLSKEYQAYESYIVSLLSSDLCKVLDKDKIDTKDSTYIAWTKDETISLKEYLNYAISMNWIDTSRLDLLNKYSDSEEIYHQLIKYILEQLDDNLEFSKKLYKYMIAGNDISGRQICIILWDQDLINVSEDKITGLRSGRINSYDFMIECISNLQITPAQLSLEPCSASCVITDVRTGDVKALVSYPSYDNNRLANSADSNYLAKLNNDKSRPLWNYATQYRSAPGSTFKMVSAVAAIEEDIVSLKDQLPCSGPFTKLTGTTHKCWIHPGGHGNLNVRGAIANSCNNFFYEVGYRLSLDENVYDEDLGIENIAKYADLFGLSEKSGIEISEADPNVSDKFPVPSAIGQGTHAYTTVGLARYVTAVANSGTCYNLTLIDQITDTHQNLLIDNNATIRNRIELPSNVWDSIHSGMREVVAQKAYFNDIGTTVAGKTGTAQEVTSRANHALFVGYAPYENPEVSFSVRVMNGYSSDYAAQITKDVVMYYYELIEKDELITGTADQPLTSTTTGD